MKHSEAKKLIDYENENLQELTPKEKLFLAEYINTNYNGTEAADRVFKCKNRNVAGVMAHEILRKPKISVFLKEYINTALDVKKDILAVQLFDVWYRRATYDPEMFIAKDGNPKFKSWDEVPKEWRCCIDAIETVRYGKEAVPETRIKLANREKASEWLDKLIAMTKEIKNIDLTSDGKSIESILNLSINGTPTVSKLPEDE